MWTHLDTAQSDGDRLDLYEGHGAHMIRVNGWELMNGRHHASEDRLGHLAGLLACDSHPRILLGGLGLGFTLAGLIETLGERTACVMVCERSAAVIEWFGRHTNRRLAAALPAGVRICRSDVADHLGADGCWDVIVLDVDNGPRALSASENCALYGEAGLRLAFDGLSRGGHLLLWSSFEDGGFVERARAAGFSVTRGLVKLPNRPDGNHIIYVLSRRPIERVECERLDLRAFPSR